MLSKYLFSIWKEENRALNTFEIKSIELNVLSYM